MAGNQTERAAYAVAQEERYDDLRVGRRRARNVTGKLVDIRNKLMTLSIKQPFLDTHTTVALPAAAAPQTPLPGGMSTQAIGPRTKRSFECEDRNMQSKKADLGKDQESAHRPWYP